MEDPEFITMGEYFIAADELVTKLKQEEEHPDGVAVARAAIDWARAGMRRPITIGELRELANHYFAHITGLDLQDNQFTTAVEWCRRKVTSSAALLIASGDRLAPVFRAFDFIVEWIDENKMSIPDATWQFVLGKATPYETLEIGLAAYTAGQLALAEQVWESTEKFKDPKWALGAVTLGDLRIGINNDRARTSYQAALSSGHPDYAPRAVLGLGYILREEGNLQGAKSAYQYAIDSGHPNHAPAAALELSYIFKIEGDFSKAESLLKYAINSGHPDTAPKASNDLGLIYQEISDWERAKSAYQYAIDSGHEEATPAAALNLGSMLEKTGYIEEAKSAYQHAIDSGHPDHAPWAAFIVAGLHEKTGDTRGAKSAYQYAIDSGHPDHAPAAALGLGLLLYQEGNITEARHAFEKARHSHNPDVVAVVEDLLRGP
jgi:tetratricopeptide (TPR) repeat protein